MHVGWQSPAPIVLTHAQDLKMNVIVTYSFSRGGKTPTPAYVGLRKGWQNTNPYEHIVRGSRIEIAREHTVLE